MHEPPSPNHPSEHQDDFAEESSDEKQEEEDDDELIHMSLFFKSTFSVVCSNSHCTPLWINGRGHILIRPLRLFFPLPLLLLLALLLMLLGFFFFPGHTSLLLIKHSSHPQSPILLYFLNYSIFISPHQTKISSSIPQN